VNTWKLRRCRIPHSIVATADLVDAILHHDLEKNSPSTIKAVYASALAKMVTSVCDLEQDSAEKRSMMEQAIKISMPEEWVQLRHAITHGQTPGLHALEDAVKVAVPWMWQHFWNSIDGIDAVTEDALTEELLDVLSQYRRQRRAMITSKQEAVTDTTLATQASKALRKSCKQRRDGLHCLVRVLLHEHIILPSEKQ
jgi:ribosomal biogenesis protein LAS1